MRTKRRNRYYKQILLALLVISILPVLFLGRYVYWFVNEQMTAVYRSYTSSLENQKEELENSFAYVDVSLMRLGLKNTCQNAVNKPREAANFQIFNAVREELRLISTTETYVSDVFLISRDQNWILGPTIFQELDQYSDQERVLRLLEMDKASFWHSEGGYLYLCKKVPINAVAGSSMLIAKFDETAMVEEVFADLNGGTAVVMDQDGRVMLNSGTDENLEEIRKAIHSPDKMNRIYRDINVASVDYAKEKYILFESKADHTGWSYMMVMPSGEITANIRGIIVIVALVLLGLLTADALAILTLSRRLYLPIDAIGTAVDRAIGRSGSEEEDQGLMDRVQYVVRQNMEMTHQLSTRTKDMQQLFLRRAYQGEIVRPGTQLFAENGFRTENWPDAVFFVMAIKYHIPFESSEDRQLYLFALDNIVSELVGADDTFPPVTIGSVMYLTCQVQTDSNESAVMKMQMQAIMISTTVNKYMGRSLNIGISQGFTNIENITLGVNESNKALQNAMGEEGGVNFYHSHHTTSESAKGYAARKKRVQLLHSIDLGEREACRKELDEYINGLSDLYYYVFKLELCKLVSEILNIYQDYALAPDYDKVGDIIDFDIGKTVNTYERLKEYLWNYLLEPLFETICSQARERDMMKQIVEYLMDNLEKDIGLEECARHFNYNANYLSRWFKKRMGKTYTDFVTEKKMELCKNLLVESDISVNDLAERFCYSSPQNFIRVFKKYTLMTPGQFRKQEREKIKSYTEI